MNNNVEKLISKCKEDYMGRVFLSFKPRIADLDTTVAHLYSAGGKMCYFNVPEGNGFHIWDKEYEKYSYGELDFVPGKGFTYLFSNWDNMIKTCDNRAHDEDNFKKGKVSGKTPVNHYERMRENMIAAYNSELSEELLAVIDMEYSVDKTKLRSKKIVKNPKADLICVAVENERIVFYVTEYKSTQNDFGVSLGEHYGDMSMYYNVIQIKEHLIKTLQERLEYGLIICNEEVKGIIRNLTVDDINVKLLFLFSDAADFESANYNTLNKRYSEIFKKSKADDVPVNYAYIGNIEKGCLKKTILRKFECDGKFELV